MDRRSAAARKQLPRLPFLEGLRGVAALYVAIGHICSMADPSSLAGRASKAPDWLRHVSAVFSYGHLAVAAFIVLSGFCLEIAVFSRGDGKLGPLPRFFIRRAQRILPAYYGCLAISIAVTIGLERFLPGMPFDIYRPVTAPVIWSHIFLYHNFNETYMYRINGVLWSIALEAQLYVLFPLLVAGLSKIGRLWTLLLAVVVAVAITPLWPHALKSYTWFLPLFAAGMAGAHLAFRPHLRFGTSPTSGTIFALTFFVATGLAVAMAAPDWLTDSFFGFGVVFICYALATVEKGIGLRLLSNRPIVVLGTFSYSLYLMHHPLQQIMFAMRPASAVDEASIWIYLVCCLPIILAVSWLYSLAFERPFVHNRIAAALPEDLVPFSLPLLSLDTSNRDTLNKVSLSE